MEMTQQQQNAKAVAYARSINSTLPLEVWATTDPYMPFAVVVGPCADLPIPQPQPSVSEPYKAVQRLVTVLPKHFFGYIGDDKPLY